MLLSLYRSTHSAPHMMAYLATIVYGRRRFEGMGWVLYNTAYRHRAAQQKDLNWSAIDSSLFNTLFTGQAKTSAKCTHCLSEDHGANYCLMANGPLTQLTRDISLSIAGTSSKRSFSPSDAAVPQAKRGNFSGSGVRFGSTDPQYCGLFNARSAPGARTGQNASTCMCVQTAPRISRKPSASRGHRLYQGLIKERGKLPLQLHHMATAKMSVDTHDNPKVIADNL